MGDKSADGSMAQHQHQHMIPGCTFVCPEMLVWIYDIKI